MNVLKKIKYISTSRSLKGGGSKPHLPNFTVVNAFNLRYPKASTIQWQQIEVSRWVAIFKLKNKCYSALYDSHGNWLDTITKVSMESIPKSVQENFGKSFVKSGIKNVCKIETINRTIFEIKWTNGILAWNFLYDISGNMVGKLTS